MSLRAGLGVAGVSAALFAACVGDDPSSGLAGDGGAPSAGGQDGAASADGSFDAAPGAGVVVDDRYSAGTRLEPSWLALPDGTRRFAGWYDKELKTTCTYRVQANGRYGCVPDAESASDSAGIYATETCTVPQAAVVEASCSRIPSFVTLTQGATCYDEVRASGAVISAPYVLTGQCVPATPDRGKAFELGPVVPSSALVQGDLEEWADAPVGAPGPRPIRAQFMRGSDGSLGFQRWVLETANAECTFSKQPFDETVRCYPAAPAAVGGAFVDAACSVPLAETQNPRTACTGETTQIAALSRRPTEGCSRAPSGIDWYAVNPAVAPMAYYENEAGECVGYPAQNANAHAVGASLSPDAFGAPRVETPAPGPAFQSLHVELADGTRGRHVLYDGGRGVACTMERTTDLSFRCVPVGSETVRTIYTDAACTETKLVSRAISSERQERECKEGEPCSDAGFTCEAPPKPAYVRLRSGSYCSFDRSMRVFTAGEPVTQYYDKDRDGICFAIPVTTGEAVYDLVEIPPGQLFGAVPSHP